MVPLARSIYFNHRTTIELNIITETDYLQLKRKTFSLIETFFFLTSTEQRLHFLLSLRRLPDDFLVCIFSFLMNFIHKKREDKT